jgi:hypothetical protein
MTPMKHTFRLTRLIRRGEQIIASNKNGYAAGSYFDTSRFGCNDRPRLINVLSILLIQGANDECNES